MNAQSQTSTTIRRYSLVAEARQNRDAAMTAWTNAYRLWLQEPTTPNLNALAAASVAHEKAEEQYQSLRISAKHNRGTVDGSDTSTKQSLSDAGFGDLGPM